MAPPPVVDQPTDKPVFDDKKITVIFVLGGPGAGTFLEPHVIGRRR